MTERTGAEFGDGDVGSLFAAVLSQAEAILPESPELQLLLWAGQDAQRTLEDLPPGDARDHLLRQCVVTMAGLALLEIAQVDHQFQQIIAGNFS